MSCLREAEAWGWLAKIGAASRHKMGQLKWPGLYDLRRRHAVPTRPIAPGWILYLHKETFGSTQQCGSTSSSFLLIEHWTSLLPTTQTCVRRRCRCSAPRSLTKQTTGSLHMWYRCSWAFCYSTAACRKRRCTISARWLNLLLRMCPAHMPWSSEMLPSHTELCTLR
jgi:hypothetical protein